MRGSSLAFLMIAALVSSLPWTGHAGESAPTPDVRVDQRIGSVVDPSLLLRDEAGKAIRFSELAEGRSIVLVLAYYRCPGVCSLVLNSLAASLQSLRKELGNEMRIVTVSIDPKEGHKLALAKKRSYLARIGISSHDDLDPRWRFLTGDENAIRSLADAVGFRYRKDPDTKYYLHPSVLTILTPKGQISRYFTGIQFPSDELRDASASARRSRLGRFVDEILIHCAPYDPEKRPSLLPVIAWIRTAAFATVFGLGMMIFWLRRREAG